MAETDTKLEHRTPLAEITTNSPGGYGRSSSSLKPKCEATRAQQFRVNRPHPPSPLSREQSVTPDIDIYDDEATTPIENAADNHSYAERESPVPPSINVLTPLTFSNNRKPQAEQTRAAEPIIKSKLPQLSSTYARSPRIHMVATPTRRSHSSKPADNEMGPQQGQGDHQQTNDVHACASATPSKASTATMLSNTPGMRSASNKENVEPKLFANSLPTTPLRTTASQYDALEAAVVEAATPPMLQSVPQSPVQAAIGHDLPTIEGLEITDADVEISQETVAEEPRPVVEGEMSTPVVKKTQSSPRSKKLVGPRPTKASMARISLAHGGQDTPRAPAWGPPRQPSGLRTSSNNKSTSSRVNSSGSTASEQSEKKQVIIPHSKPRPMSMSFPSPAPLPKSAKVPTRPAFQLPGEVVAQKLKEARELREKKDDGKKVFKARPVPASVRTAPVVRPTNASRAREFLGLGKDLPTVRATSLHSRASSVAAVRPSDRKSSISSSRATSSGSDKPSTLSVSGRLYHPKRASSSLANIGKPRVASPSEIAAAQALKAAHPIKQGPISGKEVYNRHMFATEAAEREKREKEEATKKARAEAAERSRLLSREWAARKRQQQGSA